jgi:alcohol dehydrogenase
MAKMKSLIFYGAREVSLEEVDRPTIEEPTDALVRITLSTICGSDLHIYHEELPIQPPFPIGHEFVGVIEELGKDVSGLKKGDRVAASCVVYCGQCYYCQKGLYGHCEKGGLYGCGPLMGNLGGAQAEYVRVPYAPLGLHRIPDELTDEQVLYVGDILTTGFTAVKNGNILPGDIVAVFGSGPVGLCAQVCAQLFGPALVIAVDKLDYRLEVSRQIGCEPLNISREDPGTQIKALTGGRGVDVAIEAVGIPATMAGCISAVRPGGRISAVGIFSQPMEFPLPLLCLMDINLTMSICDVQWIPALIKLIQNKKIDLTFLGTHSMALADSSEAYKIFDQKQDRVLKILLRP